MVVEVATVPLCWPTTSALQKPRSPESYAAPLPTAVPDTSLPSSPHWGHPIRRRKDLPFFSPVQEELRRTSCLRGMLLVLVSVSCLLLSLISRAKWALWVTTARAPMLALIHSLLWRKHAQYKKTGTCHTTCRCLSRSQPLAIPTPCSKNRWRESIFPQVHVLCCQGQYVQLPHAFRSLELIFPLKRLWFREAKENKDQLALLLREKKFLL